MNTNFTTSNITQAHNPRPATINTQGPDVLTNPHKIDYADNLQCDIKGLHFHNRVQAQPSEVLKTANENIFLRCWNWFRGFFGFGKKASEISKPVAGTKVYLHEPLQKPIIEKPPVYIYDGLVDLKFVKENIDKYVFVFAGNVEKQPGRFGQSAVLRPAKEMYPESVAELPITQRPVTAFDPTQVPKVALKEDSAVDLSRNIQLMSDAIDDAITKAKNLNKTILLLKGGYGTGFARMYVFAPKSFNEMNRLFEEKLGVRQVLDLITGQFSVDYTDGRDAELKQDDKITKPTAVQNKPQTSNLWNTGWSMIEHGKTASN